MSVMIIIKRVFRMDQTNKLVPLLKELRSKSEIQPGFISRTTYSNLSDPGELVVIMEWKTADGFVVSDELSIGLPPLDSCIIRRLAFFGKKIAPH